MACQGTRVTSSVGEAYDAIAEQYAALFLHELDEDVQSQRWLREFAAIAREQAGPVADLGCGPGSSVRHLHDLGVNAFGADLSPGQLAQARQAHPGLPLIAGDLTNLGHADSALGGIVARHSIIHLNPSDLGRVFAEWRRVLAPGAPLFLSFFGSRTAAAHGEPFDHKVTTAYELFPATVGTELEDAGFVDVQVEAMPIAPGGRPFDHTTILTCASPIALSL